MAKSDADELKRREERKEAGQSGVEIIKNDEWKIFIVEERPIASLQKVPRELREREENKGLFDPRVVSMGPYHHGKPELEEAEKFKSRGARTFIADSNREREFYHNILEVVSDARKCYLPGSTDTYDDQAFARMMLLDGCFILQFIDAHTNTRQNEPFLLELAKQVGVSAYRVIISDIVLLENQLPFIVLQTLIRTKYPDSRGEELMENFILKVYIDNMATWTKKTYKHEKVQPPLHFLDLVRRRFLGRYSPKDEEFSSEEDKDGCRLYSFKTIIPFLSRRCSVKTIIPFWCRRGHSRDTKSKDGDAIKDAFTYSFRSAKELKAKGIHFRPSTTFFLNDFAFTSRFGYGRLTLPQLVFGYGMRYFLLNMMAYELAPSIELIEWEICNYIYFMNSLINGAEDVMELRTHGVIHNFYGTDEEVAKAFNSMATGGAFVCYQGPIKDANDGIQEHYNSTMKTWTAQLWNNYFSTPWSAVAFLAATFALILTIIQTFFPR